MMLKHLCPQCAITTNTFFTSLESYTVQPSTQKLYFGLSGLLHLNTQAGDILQDFLPDFSCTIHHSLGTVRELAQKSATV